MVVRSGNTEFGYELIATLPYAYWHHKNGALSGTESGRGSEPLYFFSPDHRIDPSPRDFANTAEAAKEIPNMWIHKPMLDLRQWCPPPLKERYSKSAITFDKPTVVVYNRYNYEWGQPPINFFDLPTLRKLFNMLKHKYQVVYFNVRGEDALEDNAPSMELGDYQMIREEHPEVIIIHDIVKQHGITYNEAQLRVFAGCEKFITMNGGPSILASYFGGENIIYTKKCREIVPTVNSFYNWYHLFGNSDITVVHTLDDLVDKVQHRWVYEMPKINILIRCHRRPKGLARAFLSIKKQHYPNVRIIASYDDDATWGYLRECPFTKIKCTAPKQHQAPNNEDYRAWLGANEYFNQMYQLVTSGYIMFLDDDDVLPEGSLWRIAELADKDHPLFFRVNCHGQVIPNDEHFGKVAPGQISGLGIVFPHHMKHVAKWTPWRRGDYRVARDLANTYGAKWVDEVLSSTGKRIDQRGDIGKMKLPPEERKQRTLEAAAALKESMEARRKKQRVFRPAVPIKRNEGVVLTSSTSRPSPKK